MLITRNNNRNNTSTKMKRKVRNLSKEHKMKIAKSMTGKKHSEESRKKMSESMKRYWSSIPKLEIENNKM